MNRILLIILTILVVSCSNDDSNSTNNSNSEIVGSWELYKIVIENEGEIHIQDDGYIYFDSFKDRNTYVFYSDGTAVHTMGSYYIDSGNTLIEAEIEGTWGYDGSNYSFNGDVINMIDENHFWEESAIIGETDYYRRLN